MAKPIRVDVKNVANGPRMFNSIPPVAIPAGQSFQDLEINADELASMQRFGEFEISGDDVKEPEPGPLDGSVEDLTNHISKIDDADEVQKLIDAETAGKSRKGALAALEARRDAILAA
jgi:hypothetical protein